MDSFLTKKVKSTLKSWFLFACLIVILIK